MAIVSLFLELSVGPCEAVPNAVPDADADPDIIDDCGRRAVGPTNNFGEGGRNRCGGVCPEFTPLPPTCEHKYEEGEASEGQVFSTVGGSITSMPSSTMTGVVLSSGDMEYPCRSLYP